MVDPGDQTSAAGEKLGKPPSPKEYGYKKFSFGCPPASTLPEGRETVPPSHRWETPQDKSSILESQHRDHPSSYSTQRDSSERSSILTVPSITPSTTPARQRATRRSRAMLFRNTSELPAARCQ